MVLYQFIMTFSMNLIYIVIYYTGIHTYLKIVLAVMWGEDCGTECLE